MNSITKYLLVFPNPSPKRKEKREKKKREKNKNGWNVRGLGIIQRASEGGVLFVDIPAAVLK